MNDLNPEKSIKELPAKGCILSRTYLPALQVNAKAEIRNLYNALAPEYAERYRGLSGKYFHEVEEECFYLSTDFADKTVLDLGTGSGRFALSLLNKGGTKRVIGVDLAERFIHEASKNAGTNEKIHFCVMDGEATAFQGAVFDVVVVLGLFEYVSDLSNYLKEVCRILKPGGKLIFTCWNLRRWVAWRFFDDRMKDSVDHSLIDILKVLQRENFKLLEYFSIFFIPTKVFFGFLHRLGSLKTLQVLYVELIITIERLLRRSFLKARGGELIIKAQKVL